MIERAGTPTACRIAQSSYITTATTSQMEWSCGCCRVHGDTPAVRNIIREGKEHQLYRLYKRTFIWNANHGLSSCKTISKWEDNKEVVLEY